MNLLNEGKEVKTEGKVQQQALEYAKSTMEAKQLMSDLVKQKNSKEKEKFLCEWKILKRKILQPKIKSVTFHNILTFF
jgi:uncharacterized membrane protein YcaP (DUF421 family)